MTGRRKALSLVLNGTFDRAIELATELEDCLALAHDLAGSPVHDGGTVALHSVDATLFRVRVLARDLEDSFFEALAIRAPLVGDYDGALGSARELVDALCRVYPLAVDLDDGRYAGVISNVDHAYACAQVFVTILEMAEERGPGQPDLTLVTPERSTEEMEEQVRDHWARILPFE